MAELRPKRAEFERQLKNKGDKRLSPEHKMQADKGFNNRHTKQDGEQSDTSKEHERPNCRKCDHAGENRSQNKCAKGGKDDNSRNRKRSQSRGKKSHRDRNGNHGGHHRSHNNHHSHTCGPREASYGRNEKSSHALRRHETRNRGRRSKGAEDFPRDESRGTSRERRPQRKSSMKSHHRARSRSLVQCEGGPKGGDSCELSTKRRHRDSHCGSSRKSSAGPRC